MAPTSKKQKQRQKQKDGDGSVVASTSVMKLANFCVLPLSVPASSSSSSTMPHPTHHYMYLRAHHSSSASSDQASLPPKRTLFCVNLPTDATERHIRSLFQTAGRIEKISMSAIAASNDALGVKEDESDEDADSDEADSDDAEEEIGGATSAPRDGKPKLSRKEAARRRAVEAKKAKPPALVPLPGLDPRAAKGMDETAGGGNPFLPTGTTAHVVFLEDGSLERALNRGAGGSVPWVDPWTEISRRQAKANQRQRAADGGAGGDDDEEDARASRKARPSTALEAVASHLSTKDPRPPMGLSYLLGIYDAHRPPLDSVKAHADSVVARYTFFRSNPRYQAQAGAEADAEDFRAVSNTVSGIKVASYGPSGEPLDEDGFTIVLPGAKYGRAVASGEGDPLGSSSVKVARRRLPDASEGPTKKKKKTENTEGLEDFYRFQMRERRKERLAEMRKQFDSDREKVDKLKEEQAQSGKSAKRRFRPY